jgi:hypothetical protein
MLIIILALLLSCTPAPEYQWEYRQERRELTEQDTTPVLSPYYGQMWECTYSKDFLVTVDTVQVRHVRQNGLLPMEGPYIQCDRMRRVIRDE